MSVHAFSNSFRERTPQPHAFLPRDTMLARYMPFVMKLCLSAHLSVTSRCSTETAKHRITQTPPRYSPRTLVFWCRKSRRNIHGVTPTGRAKFRWGALNAADVAENGRLSAPRVANLTRSQVYHTLAVLQCVARSLTATADPCYVRPSQVGVLLKQLSLDVGSRKQATR